VTLAGAASEFPPRTISGKGDCQVHYGIAWEVVGKSFSAPLAALGMPEPRGEI